MRTPSILARCLHGEYAAGRAMIEPRDQRSLAGAERAAARREIESAVAIQRAHVDRAAERKISVQRARRAFYDVDAGNDLREEQVQIVVSLGVTVDGLVVRHA